MQNISLSCLWMDYGCFFLPLLCRTCTLFSPDSLGVHGQLYKFFLSSRSTRNTQHAICLGFLCIAFNMKWQFVLCITLIRSSSRLAFTLRKCLMVLSSPCILWKSLDLCLNLSSNASIFCMYSATCKRGEIQEKLLNFRKKRAKTDT